MSEPNSTSFPKLTPALVAKLAPIVLHAEVDRQAAALINMTTAFAGEGKANTRKHCADVLATAVFANRTLAVAPRLTPALVIELVPIVLNAEGDRQAEALYHLVTAFASEKRAFMRENCAGGVAEEAFLYTTAYGQASEAFSDRALARAQNQQKQQRKGRRKNVLPFSAA